MLYSENPISKPARRLSEAAAADLLQVDAARIATLERPVGRQALELEFLKGAQRPGPRPRSGPTSAIIGPAVSASPRALLMGPARSTPSDVPMRAVDDTAIVEATICDAFEHCGWRLVQAALRQKGLQVDHKRVRRPMREHDLQPKMRRRVTKTTDSDHDQPIFPNLAEKARIDGADRLCVAEPKDRAAKTRKVEGAYPMAFETFADVLESVPRFIEETHATRRRHSAISAPRSSRIDRPGRREPAT